MPLSAVVTDITAVDETVRGFYVEKDGKFVLDVAAADGLALENTTGLKTALSAERARREEFERTLRLFDGLDATAARKALDDVKAYGDLTPQAAKEALETAKRLQAIDPEKEADKRAAELLKAREEQLTGVFTQRETALKTEVENSQKTVSALREQLRTVMVDAVIKGELAKLNPLDDARDAVELLAMKAIRPREVDGQIVVEVVDDKGLARINTDLSPVTVAQYLKELRESRPGLFKPDPISGTGIAPNSSTSNPHGNQTNPWAKESWNVTQQMVLENTKPDLAKQLMAQAGVQG